VKCHFVNDNLGIVAGLVSVDSDMS